MEGFVLSSLEVGRVAANLLDHVVDFFIVEATRAQVVTQRLLDGRLFWHCVAGTLGKGNHKLKL